MISADEKRGGSAQPDWLIKGFRDVVVECGLYDLPLIGHLFTWKRKEGNYIVMEERLDRAMVTQSWLDMFPNARLLNLVAPISNHSTILV